MNNYKAILDRIQNIIFFRNCGNPINVTVNCEIEYVSNWSKARTNYNDAVWEETTLEASNKLAEFLSSKCKNRFNTWNQVTKEAKVFLEDKIKPNLVNYIEHNALDNVLVDCVMWDLLGAIMETAYDDCKNRPVFFLELLKIYESGNFPCGWHGQYPNGRLIVF